MKKLYLLILIIFFTNMCIWPESYPLNNPAKSVISEVKTYNWKSSRGWFENQTTKIIIQNYNSEGYIESEELYYSENELMEKTEYTYEDNMVRKITTNQKNEITRTAEVIYDNDIITETVFLQDRTQLFKYISTLNSKKQVTELKFFNSKNELLFIKKYIYTESGDIASITLHNPDGSIAALIEIDYESYDRKGNWLVRSEYYTYADVWSRPRDKVYRTIEY